MLTKSELQDLKDRAQFAKNHGYELAHAKGYVMRLEKALGAPLNQSVCPNTPDHVLALIAQLEEGECTRATGSAFTYEPTLEVGLKKADVVAQVEEVATPEVVYNITLEVPAEVAPVVAQEAPVAVSDPVVEEDAPVVAEVKEEEAEALGTELQEEAATSPETVSEEVVAEEKPVQGKGKKGRRSN